MARCRRAFRATVARGAFWFLLASFSGAPAWGQEGVGAPEASLVPRGVAAGWGLRRLNQSDRLVSPLRYHGFSWSTWLTLDLSTTRSIRAFRASYSAGELTSDISEGGRHLEVGHWVDVQGAWFRTIWTFQEDRFSLLLGGALTARVALYEHRYTEDDREKWSDAFGLLEPGAAWHARMPWGGILWQEVTFPLAGVVFRPPYQGLTEAPDPSWEGVGGVSGIHHSIHYRRPFGGGWWGGLSYAFEGLRYAEPRPLAWARHALTVHLTLPWWRP